MEYEQKTYEEKKVFADIKRWFFGREIDLSDFPYIAVDPSRHIYAYKKLPTFHVIGKEWLVLDTKGFKHLFCLDYEPANPQNLLFEIGLFQRNGSLEDMIDRDKEGMRQQGKYNKDITDWTNYRKRVQQEKAIAKRNIELQNAHYLIDNL